MTKLINCVWASETGFSNGVPLTIESETYTHKEAVLKALETEIANFRPTKQSRIAVDSAIHWLESIHEQEVYAPPYGVKP